MLMSSPCYIKPNPHANSVQTPWVANCCQLVVSLILNQVSLILEQQIPVSPRSYSSGRFFQLIDASWWRLNRRGNLNRSEVAFRGVRFISVNYKRHGGGCGAAPTFLTPRSISHQKVTNQTFFHALLTGVRLWEVIYFGRLFWDFIRQEPINLNGIIFRADNLDQPVITMEPLGVTKRCQVIQCSNESD